MIAANQVSESGADLALADAEDLLAEYDLVDAAYAEVQSKLDAYDADPTSAKFDDFVAAHENLDALVDSSESGAYLSLMSSRADMLDAVDGFLSTYDAYRTCSGFSEVSSSGSLVSSAVSSAASSVSSMVSADPPCEAERIAYENAKAQAVAANQVKNQKFEAWIDNVGVIQQAPKTIKSLLAIAEWQAENNTWIIPKEQLEADLAAEKKKLADAKAKDAGLKQEWEAAMAAWKAKAEALTAAEKAYEDCKRANNS